MEVHPGVFVSRGATEEWEPDPEVEARIEIASGPTLELGPGDMASLPQGAETRKVRASLRLRRTLLHGRSRHD